MDTTYGVLCLIPPIVAIGLALWTKQTIFSLFIAVWLGSTMMNGFNPLVGFVKIISDYMIPSLSGNASLIILVTLSGGMIAMLRNTGAAEAFATKVTKVINTAKKGQIVTCLSAFIFSYTEPCLMLGTIMRPVTDMVRISRAKLAYILDSMGCNLAALSPISSYGPFITGLIAAELLASGVEGNEMGHLVEYASVQSVRRICHDFCFDRCCFRLELWPYVQGRKAGQRDRKAAGRRGSALGSRGEK